MEKTEIFSKKDVWSDCYEKTKGYLKRSDELQERLAEKDLALRQIDPAFLDKARYSSQDYFFVKVVKTIYYIVRRFFYSHQSAKLLGEKKGIQAEIEERKASEAKVLKVYNRVFQRVDNLRNIPESVDSFEPDILNRFLDAEELKGTFLEIDKRCCDIVADESCSLDSFDEGYFSCSEDDQYFSCSEEGEEVLPSDLTIDNLLNPEVKNVFEKIFPLNQLVSIKQEKENIYKLEFSSKLVGRLDRTIPDFNLKLEPIIRERLKRWGDLASLKKKFSSLRKVSVRKFLDVCKINTLDDIAGLVHWNYLSEAYKAAEKSQCEIDPVLTVRIGDGEIELIKGDYLVSIFVTDYHLIKKNLFSPLIQLCLYKISMQEPYSSKLFFRKVQVIRGEEIRLTFSFESSRSGREGVVSFTPQVFDFIGHVLKWCS